MNGWGITGLVLLFLALLILVIRFYVERNRYKAKWQHAEKDAEITNQMIEEHAERQTRVVELLTENDTLKAYCSELEARRKSILAELESVAAERDGLKLQLEEALRPKSPPPSDGEVKKRVPRIRPTSMEPPSKE